MAEHNDLGKQGERIAADFLERKGFEILDRNWHYEKKEVDLFAHYDDKLIVVEVRTRQSEHWEHPKETITDRKIRCIVEATEAYIEEHDINQEVRFDVVTVMPRGEDWEIEHIEEAFHPLL